MDNLIYKIQDAAQADGKTQWFNVATTKHITFVESVIDIHIPELLKRCYTDISNGGFGPGYGITGLPGGHESSWGDIVQTTTVLRELDECEEGWLPLIGWGCAQFPCVDCDDNMQMVTLLEGDFHHEDYTIQTLLERWCQGEIPDLHSGSFYRQK